MFKQNFSEIKKQVTQKYQPEVCKLNDRSELLRFEKLHPSIQIHSEIQGQLFELIKIENPTIDFKKADVPTTVKEYGKLDYRGVWFYYPWKNTLVHILQKNDFIKVRTNRNLYKITAAQQTELGSKTVGIVGLSVGSIIATTMAMERVAGTFKLADFDTLELSNLNRIKSGIDSLGLSKVVVTARQILEIDPYINIELFNEGISKENIDSFLGGKKPVDILIEECDTLYIKFLVREKCKSLRIPLLMDTSERNMLDIERYDLNKAQPLFNGVVKSIVSDQILKMSEAEKFITTVKIVGPENISLNMKASFMEIRQSIATWPQLASSVIAGGGYTTSVARRILLGEKILSGRYMMDAESTILAEPTKPNKIDKRDWELRKKDIINAKKQKQIIDRVKKKFPDIAKTETINNKTIKLLVEAAITAPSGGNTQPWEWIFHQNTLYLFHRTELSHSLLDSQKYGSYIAFGCAITNLNIAAKQYGYTAKHIYFPDKDSRLISCITFTKNSKPEKEILYNSIFKRVTNREVSPQKISELDKKNIIQLGKIKTAEGLILHTVTDEATKRMIGEFAGHGTVNRFLSDRGHYDLFEKEIRWTKKEYERTKTGIDLDSLGVGKAEETIFRFAAQQTVMHSMRKFDGGSIFFNSDVKAALNSVFIGIIASNKHDNTTWIEAGKLLQETWLWLTNQGYAIQPIAASIFTANQIQNLPKYNKHEEAILKKWTLIKNILPKEYEPKFIIRIYKPIKKQKIALRKDTSEVLKIIA